MSFSLKLFGGASLAAASGPIDGSAAQRHRLALLAVLATSAPKVVSRDKLIAWLWPERDAERARGLLNQAVYVLRQALGPDAILASGDTLRLDPDLVEADVVAFERALAAGDRERAIAVYAGPFLDGFFLDDSQAFERWVERERQRLAGAYARALEELAESAERLGHAHEATAWWKRLAAHDPYDSRVALRLVDALDRAGNRAGAIQHAESHVQMLVEDLALAPPPEVVAVLERLRSEQVAMPIAPRAHVPRRAAARVVAAAPASEGSPPPRPSSPMRRRLRVGTAAVLAVGAIAMGIRLASVRGGSNRAPAPAAVDQIARAVAREVWRRARGDTTRSLAQLRTSSIPAYELLLRGSDPTLLRSDSGALQGLRYFRQAVALDSGYAAAWAGLARLTLRVAEDVDLMTAAAMRADAEAAARRAIALDDSLAEGHAILGLARSIAYQFPEAERHFRHAVELEPGWARIREWVVDFYLSTGRPAEALLEAETALALDSLSPSATAELARALLANGRCGDALARLERLAALNPPLARAAPIAAQCYARLGRWADGIAQLRPQADRGEQLSLALLGYVMGRAGQRQQALDIQAKLEERWRRGVIGARYLAIVPIGLGDRDLAFLWLDRAAADRSAGLFPGMRVSLADPVFDDLRDDPRLAPLRSRAGLPPL